MTFLNLRKIYHAVVLPRILYGCSAWYIPPGEAGHRKQVIEWLKSIQYQGLKLVAGAYKATSTAALEVETYTKPIPQQLEKQLFGTAMRIRTSTMHQSVEDIRNPRRRRIARTAWQQANWTWSPLEKVEHYLRSRIRHITEQNIEPQKAYITTPWWQPPEIRIALSKGLGMQEHDTAIRNQGGSCLVLYTDGSCINDKVGAAAVTANGAIIYRAYLGRSSEATVYAAELRGILSALQIAYQSNKKLS